MPKLSWTVVIGASLLLNVAQADELLMPQAASATESESPASATEAEMPAPAATTETMPSETASMAEEETPAAEPAVVNMPEKGLTMAAVVKAFGEPKTKHKPAGGDSPRHPAITRWDYEGFSVFFEKNKVINSVNPQQPAKLQHTDKLKPLEY